MGIITLTKHAHHIEGSARPEPGAGAPEVETTPKMIAAGVAIYRDWEDAHGLDANGAWSPANVTVGELIRRLLRKLPISGHPQR